LKLSDFYKLETGKLIHRFVHNLLPPSFTDYFKRSSDISTRTTRSSTNPNNLSYLGIKLIQCKISRC